MQENHGDTGGDSPVSKCVSRAGHACSYHHNRDDGPISYEAHIRADEQKRLSRRFQNIGWRDPRVSDEHRQVMFWVASMIENWVPPANDEGRVMPDGKRWAPLNEPVSEWDMQRDWSNDVN